MPGPGRRKRCRAIDVVYLVYCREGWSRDTTRDTIGTMRASARVAGPHRRIAHPLHSFRPLFQTGNPALEVVRVEPHVLAEAHMRRCAFARLGE